MYCHALHFCCFLLSAIQLLCSHSVLFMSMVCPVATVVYYSTGLCCGQGKQYLNSLSQWLHVSHTVSPQQPFVVTDFNALYIKLSYNIHYVSLTLHIMYIYILYVYIHVNTLYMCIYAYSYVYGVCMCICAHTSGLKKPLNIIFPNQ